MRDRVSASWFLTHTVAVLEIPIFSTLRHIHTSSTNRLAQAEPKCNGHAKPRHTARDGMGCFPIEEIGDDFELRLSCECE